MANPWDAVTEVLTTELEGLLLSFSTDVSADISGIAKEIALDMTTALREGNKDVANKLIAQLHALEEVHQIKLAKDAMLSLDKVIEVVFNVLASALIPVEEE
jgi:hypothetical protein